MMGVGMGVWIPRGWVRERRRSFRGGGLGEGVGVLVGFVGMGVEWRVKGSR